MYGVGAAIAIGVIALPIMMSQGIPARVAAPAFTMGIGAGTFVNLVQFGTFQKLFPGHQVRGALAHVWMIGMVVYMLIAWLMIYLNLRRLGVRHGGVDRSAPRRPPRKRTPYYTYIVPVFPVLMIMVFKWQIIPTFLLSIVLALALTWKDRSFQGQLNLFNKTFYDAFPDIATIAALWTICGMIIVAGQTPQVAGALKPIFDPILPHNPLQAAVFFALLGGVLQHLSRSAGGGRHRRGVARDPAFQQRDSRARICMRCGLRRPSCREASIRPIPGRCGPSATPRYRTDSS